MKIEFFENEVGSSVDLVPETPEELAALLRMANNSKSEQPDISVHFSTTPQCSIWIRKVEKVKQVNYLSAKNNNRVKP